MHEETLITGLHLLPTDTRVEVQFYCKSNYNNKFNDKQNSGYWLTDCYESIAETLFLIINITKSLSQLIHINCKFLSSKKEK